MQLGEFLSILEGHTSHSPKLSGGGYSARCPCNNHNDKSPSLSVSETNEGKILLFCHAGCSFDEICQELGLEPAQLCGDSTHSKDVGMHFVYTDENGNALYRKVKKNSSCYYFETLKNGVWKKGLKDSKRVLYNLPELMDAINSGQSVVIVEGEKDVEKLRRYGYVATTIDTGGGKNKWKTHHSKIFKDADVILFYDYDKTGVEHRDNIIKQLKGYVSSLKLVDIPGFEIVPKSGKDISDWLKEGHTAKDLDEIIERANFILEDIVDKNGDNKLNIIKSVSLEQLLKMVVEPPEYFLDPFISSSSLGMIYADRGLGKTFFALCIALSIASGVNFLKYKAPKPRRVIYLDGEMSLHTMKNRIERISPVYSSNPPNENFRLVNPYFQEFSLPDLASKSGQKMLDPIIQDADVIIVDNLSCWITSGIEDKGESWLPVQDWALKQRRQGKAVVFIHHANKSNNQRGTSRREDVLDYVIKLNKVKGCKAENGAIFEVVFEKNRSLYGDDVRKIQAKLIDLPEGKLSWEWSYCDDDEEVKDALIKEMAKEGKSQRYIAKEVGSSASTVCRKLKK